MNKDFLEYLYVTGELDKEDALSNPTINELYSIYNSMFPDSLDNEFFSLSIDDQISLLEEAINSRSPIIKKNK